jgi:hypothetical protein
VSIEGGEVKVDTGDLLQRQSFESAQVVYP